MLSANNFLSSLRVNGIFWGKGKPKKCEIKITLIEFNEKILFFFKFMITQINSQLVLLIAVQYD